MTRETRLLAACGVAWGLAAALPTFVAAAFPPAGRWFTGFLFFQDDFFQYLSFAEQAARGAFLFTNKFALFRHEPFLFNPEWWLAGVLSIPLGRNPAAGFYALGLLSAVLLWLSLGRALSDAGCGGPGLVWRVCLVATGGGLGLWRFAKGVPFLEIPDLGLCLFPWTQAAYGGAHAVLALGLLLSSVTLFVEWLTAGGKRRKWVASATLLALVRPFDAALFACVAGALALSRSGSLVERLSRGLELAWLAPVAFYGALTYAFHPAFATWSSAQNTTVLPFPREMLYAFAPALALASPTLWARPAASLQRTMRNALWLIVGGVGLALASGLPFALQFANCLGAVLLTLAAIALPRRIIPATTFVLSASSFALLWVLLNPSPNWFAPRDYLTVTREIRSRGRPGDRVMAPPDLGLIVAAYTPCNVVVGHRVLTPDYTERAAEAAQFYKPAQTSAGRLAYLAFVDARFLATPPSPGPPLRDGSFALVLTTPIWDLWQRSLAPSPHTP